MGRRMRWLKATAVVAMLSTFIAVVGLTASMPADAGSPAAFTTVNENVDGTGHCQNGNPTVNCTIYDGKDFVWMNGGPVGASLADGSYFFAVVSPGGQADPFDGAADLLSSDAVGDRTLSVASGVISYSGSHDFDSNEIRLMPYADTPNPGGVYIMAICSTTATKASDCKYDAFKAEAPGSPPLTQLDDLTVLKSASGSYKNTYAWTITKDVDKSLIKQAGGNATFNYTVTVTPDGGTISDVEVHGTISVFNPNAGDVSGVDVTDQLSDGTVCTVTGGSNVTVPQGATQFPYSCDLGSTVPSSEDNTVTATWPTQFTSTTFLPGNSASFTFSSISFAETDVDACVSVSDTSGGSLGSKCVSDTARRQFTYPRSIPVLAGCHTYDNTATSTTSDLGLTDTASKTVTLCGPTATGALTIGFWKNGNGNALINTYCAPGGKQSLAGYLSNMAPFADASGKSCAQLVTYVNGVIKGATSTNMNVMLRAQMLATALDVYFSDASKGWTSTTVGKVKPPANFLPNAPIGSFNMDMTAVCPMVDNTTAGSANCTGLQPSTDAFASGAVPSAAMTVQAILTYESTAPSPFNGSVSNPVWYAGNRTLQEVAKNIFDQINNQLAFGA